MENIQFVIENYNTLGIGNILKCLISALSINEDTVIRCDNDYIYGQYDTVLDDTFICKDTVKNRERVYSCRLLILQEEDHLQQDIPSEEWYMGGLENPKFHNYFSFSKRIDWNYDSNKIHPIIKNRIFNIIDKIIFKPIIIDTVDKIYATFKDDNTLGISVRTWKSKHECDVNRPYNFEIYKAKIIEIKNITKIVLSIDNESFIDDYLQLFHELNIPYVVLAIDNLNDIQYAVCKMLLLSKCNYFIGNRISTFSELVFWFSKHNINVFTVF